jgi:hypothetical protein
MSPLRPDDRRLFGRFTFVAASLLLLANWQSQAIVTLLLPAIEAEIRALDDNIRVESLDLVQDRTGAVVRMRANTVRPIYFRHFIVYPLGLLPNTRGWYQVFANARGVLLAPLIFLIALLSWPQRKLRELLMRSALGLPLLALLFCLDTPLDLLGNFQSIVIHTADRSTTPPLFYWDRFLEGGGSEAIAIAFATIAIALTASRPAHPAACHKSVASCAYSPEKIRVKHDAR